MWDKKTIDKIQDRKKVRFYLWKQEKSVASDNDNVTCRTRAVNNMHN